MDIDSYEENRKVRWWPFASFVGLIFVIFLVFFLVTDNSDLRSPLEPTTGCVVMKDRGDYSNSINIVFLGTAYDDVRKFQEDSDRFMNDFLEVVPFNSYPERFNFFRIESLGNYGCAYDDAVICNPSLSQREATKCPGHDYVVVLTDQSNVKDFFKHLRSSSWLNLMSINVADDTLVLAHEFAHAFADFADEYEYGGTINWDSPNCDSEYKTCPKFSSVEGSECIVGCVNSENSRSVKVGIMRDYWAGKTYGIYDETVLKNLIEKNTRAGGEVNLGGTIQKSPTNVYIVSGVCVASSCSITDVQKSPGYVSENKFIDSSVVVESGDFAVNVPVSNKPIFTDYGLEKDMRYLEEQSFSVAIPVTKEDIILRKEGTVEDVFSFEGFVFGGSKKVKIS